MSTVTRVLAILASLVVLAAACGGGDTTTADADSTATTEPATEAPTTEDAPTEAPTTADPIKDPPASEPVAPVATPTQAPTVQAEPAPPPQPTEPLPAETVATPDNLNNAMGDMGGDASYASYVRVTDDTGAIELEIPEEWGQVDGRPYTDDQGRQLFDVRAAPDLQAFADTWDVPGVIVTASREVAQSENEVTLLDELVGPFSGACTYLGREPYDDGLYVGQFDVFDACGGTATGYIILGAVPTSRAFVIRVQVQVVAERDLEALGRVLQSFVIVGDV